MAKATPGPWTVTVSAADNEWVAAGPNQNGDMYIAKTFGPDRVANARLIAAAPAMSDALKLALDRLELFLDTFGDMGERYSTLADIADWRAIASAESSS